MRYGAPMTSDAAFIPLPDEVRALLDAPNFVHLATVRPDGSPRSQVVWVAVEGDHVLVCTGASGTKGRDMLRDPHVSMSVVDMENPYRMASLRGRVVEVRPDEDGRYMDPISVKYTGSPFPMRGAGRVCFVIAVERASSHTLPFRHTPA